MENDDVFGMEKQNIEERERREKTKVQRERFL
jgi:hypothetical protein